MNKIIWFILSTLFNGNGIDVNSAKKMENYFERNKQLLSIIVYHRNSIVFEKYGHGVNRDNIVDLNSITKSVISLLVGILVKNGKIKSLDQKVCTFLPELFAGLPNKKSYEIEIRHLLSMRSGIFYSFDYDAFQRKRKHKEPLNKEQLANIVSEPGMKFNYSEIDAHLVSMLISEVSQMSTYEFAEKNLFHKLNFDIKENQWEKDQNNIYYGDYGLRLKPLEILDFAKIYLNEGQFNGDAIVTGQWVNETFRAYSNGGWPLYLKYGYMWWCTEYFGYKAFIAYGSGTQFVCIIPELHMIIQMSCAEKNLAEE